MSNCYTNCCFALTLTRDEATLLRNAVTLAEFLEQGPEANRIAEFWLGLPETFRAAFPANDEDPISGFISLFPDADYPTFGTSFTFDEKNDGNVVVFAHADQFEPDAVAALLQRTITLSLPVAVTWSFDSDRQHPDAFGGGGFRIDTAGVHWIGTSMVRDKHHFSPKLVIAMRDEEEGLLFWNEEHGFGSLDEAAVYTEELALQIDLPIADDQPEWLQLPSSLVA